MGSTDYRLSPTVSYRVLDELAVLLDHTTDDVLRLNPSAGRVLPARWNSGKAYWSVVVMVMVSSSSLTSIASCAHHHYTTQPQNKVLQPESAITWPRTDSPFLISATLR